MQKSTVRGSQEIGVAVNEGTMAVDVGSGVYVRNDTLLAVVGNDCATAVCTAGTQDVRNREDTKSRINRFAMKKFAGWVPRSGVSRPAISSEKKNL